MIREITLTDGSKTQLDYIDWLKWCCYSWSANKGGYVVAPMDGRMEYLHKLVAQRLGLTGDIDHEDRNRLNNTGENLRPATSSQNAANAVCRINNSTQYKGVHWHKQRKRFYAQLMVNRRHLFLGYFDSANHAATAYNTAAIRHFGPFACLNEVL